MSIERPAPMTVIASREMYRTRWMRLREDTVRYPDGDHAPYGVVERGDYVLVLARHGEDLLLVRQYRHPIGRWFWEFPSGSCARGETDVESARRELEEETGWQADDYEVVGRLHEAAAYADHSFAVVRARLRRQGAPRLDREEVGMEAELVSPARLRRMILDGELQDAPSLAAMYLLEHAGWGEARARH